MRILLSFLLLTTCLCHAQRIKVVEKNRQLPLNAVEISDTAQIIKVYTNPKGIANLKAFRGLKIVQINKEGYNTQQVNLNDLNASELSVFELDKKPLGLNETVISVSKWQQFNAEVPNRVLSIGKEQIAEQNPQTTADLLAANGQVFVQKSQMGGGSPMIRGFAANRLLIAVDGIRMNNAIFRSGNLQNVIALDANAVEQTEVLFGPGSLVYGSDAIGGVMNFYTLDPKLSYEKKTSLTANALARYSTANNEKTGHADFNIFGKNFSSLTSFTYSDFDDLQMGSHGPNDYLRTFYVERQDGEDRVRQNNEPKIQKFTGYSQFNLMQKFLYQANDDLFLTWATHYSRTSDVPRYDRLTRTRDGLPRDAEWNYGPQSWLMNHLKVNHIKPTLLYDQLSLNIANQRFEESRITRDFQSDIRTTRTENVDVWSLNLDMTRTINKKNLLFYGAEILSNKVNSKAQEQNIVNQETQSAPTRYPDGSTWNSYAVYAMNEYKPNRLWTFQGGLRFNYVRSKSQFSNEFYDFPFDRANVSTGAFNGNLGVVYKPSPKQELRAIFSTGFRAPNIDDVGKVFDSEPGNVVVPNPDLVYEYAYNGELGWGRMLGKNFRFDLTAYYTRLTDALVRRDFQLNGMDSIVYEGEMSRVQAIQNASKAIVYGIHAGLEAHVLNNFTLRGNISFQRGEEEEENGDLVPLRHVSPLFGNLSLRYEKKKFTALANLRFNGEIPYSRLAPSQQNNAHLFAADANGNPFSPSWYTLNLNTSYKLSDYINLGIGWENITDQRYRTYSSGIAAAGSNFVFSLRGQL